MYHLTNITLLSLLQNFRDLDIGILKGIYENRNPDFDSFFIGITNSAGALAFGIPGILLIIALIRKNTFLRRNALLILIPVVISAILANVLKYTFNLPRPYEIYPFIQKLSGGGSPSFPSGHTTDAFAFAVAAALVFRKWYILIPALIWAFLVGYSRMNLGVHFPSDVLAGALIGAICSSVYYWYEKRKHPL
ncbi:MAG: phosphatase PAP2 family protein [Lentimicrobiaceae bacterium]|jgi:undecaprenyl-diphosphatase